MVYDVNIPIAISLTFEFVFCILCTAQNLVVVNNVAKIIKKKFVVYF